MNAVKHCQISVRRWGGVEQDYLAIHSFIDHSKSLCADARHRILHTHWALNHLVVPIFGHTLVNADGKSVDVKDMCERDHFLADYHNKFIPTLSDFAEAIDDDVLPSGFANRIDAFHSDHVCNKAVSELLLSPLACTGRLKSLLFTHNSWFINTVLPRIFQTEPVIQEFMIKPADLFNAMRFELWMDNGISFPESAKMLKTKLLSRT